MADRPAPAVLVTGFNRTETLRQVLEAVRAARPAGLYVAMDGPRPDRPTDARAIGSARALLDDAGEWEFPVHVRLRDRNLGCGVAMADAITWFLTAEPEGIILEDDCLPHPAFFAYCAELLERYRDDERVMTISGVGALRGLGRSADTYTLTRTPLTWGWATWRRAWQRFDFDMSGWPALRDSGWLNKLGGGAADHVRVWRTTFDRVHVGRADVWDYQWTFAHWRHDGLTVLPHINLIRNIGFGPDATHTFVDGAGVAALPLEAPGLPLRHPAAVVVDEWAERYVMRTRFGTQLPLLHPRRVRGALGALARRSKAGRALLARWPARVHGRSAA